MEFYLERVTEEKKDVLYRLLQYSLYEESTFNLREMNSDGVYEYRWFDKYFTDSNRDAFFVKDKESGKLCGYVMLNEYVIKVDEGHSVAEFMIIPAYRRKGLGKQVAMECFKMYPGSWEVAPVAGSRSAYLFWKNVVDEYTDGKNIFEDGIFIFEK